LTNAGRTTTEVNPLDETQNSASAEYPRRTVAKKAVAKKTAPRNAVAKKAAANARAAA
jgi:hypothetical protein